MAPFAQHPAWEPEEQQTLGMLLTAAARSTESAILLLAYGQLWDAEALLRSVAEATLKFVYITQSRAEFKARMEEYSVHLYKISLLKDDQKVKELLEVLGDPTSREWQPIRDRLLADEERKELSQLYDKATRRTLDMKWGFVGIIDTLKRSQDPAFKSIGGLLHGYAIGSHIHHADFHGIVMPSERSMREPGRRASAHSAHLARLISDAFVYFIFRLSAAYRYIGHDLSAAHQAQSQIDALKKTFGAVYEEFLDAEYPA